MKKIFLILLGLTMLSCSPNINIVETQKVVSKEQAIKEGSRKIGEDLKKQNYLTLIIDSKVEGYKDGDFIDIIHLSNKIFKKYPNPNQWDKVDSELEGFIKKYQQKDYFHAVGQHISSTIVWDYLLKADKTPQIEDKMVYYSKMMVDTESVNWFVFKETLPLIINKKMVDKQIFFDYVSNAVPKDKKKTSLFIKNWNKEEAEKYGNHYSLELYKSREKNGADLLDWINSIQN